MANPYEFDPNIDADLWGQSYRPPGANPSFVDDRLGIGAPKSSLHESSPQGMECPHCGKVHIVPEGFDKLPRSLNALLAAFFTHFEAGNVATLNAGVVSEAMKFVASVISFASDVKHSGHDGPLLVAVAEVLDELTEGKVTEHFELYVAEHELMSTHMILKVLNGFVDQIEVNTKAGVIDPDIDEAFIHTAQHLRAFYHDQVTRAAERYTAACQARELPINSFLIDNGRYDTEATSSPFHAYVMLHHIDHPNY